MIDDPTRAVSQTVDDLENSTMLAARYRLFCICHAEGFASFEGDQPQFASVDGPFTREVDGRFRCVKCGGYQDDPSCYPKML